MESSGSNDPQPVDGTSTWCFINITSTTATRKEKKKRKTQDTFIHPTARFEYRRDGPSRNQLTECCALSRTRNQTDVDLWLAAGIAVAARDTASCAHSYEIE